MSVVLQEWVHVAPGPMPGVQKEMVRAVISRVLGFLGIPRTVDYRETRARVGQILAELDRRHVFHGPPPPEHVATSEPSAFERSRFRRKALGDTGAQKHAALTHKRGARWEEEDVLAAMHREAEERRAAAADRAESRRSRYRVRKAPGSRHAVVLGDADAASRGMTSGSM